MPDRELDRELSVLASRQHGCFTRADVLRLGGSDALIRRRVQAGRWVRLERAVYRLMGVPPNWEGRVASAVLACGEGALASHQTAAALWQLKGAPNGRPHVSVPLGRAPRAADARVHTSADLHLAGATKRDGIATTGIARTLLDLAASVDEETLERYVDDAIRRALVRWTVLVDTLTDHAKRGRPGIASFRSFVGKRAFAPVPDSNWARSVARRLVRAGLPEPEFEYEVSRSDGGLYRVDLAYPGLKIAIELDGSIHLVKRVHERDLVRQNELSIQGWFFLRYTWDAYRLEPDRIVTDVLAARDLRLAALNRPRETVV